MKLESLAEIAKKLGKQERTLDQPSPLWKLLKSLLKKK
jgi:hypothetical protein